MKAYLGCQAFKKSSESFVLHDVFDDHHSTLLRFEVLVLYPSLGHKIEKSQSACGILALAQKGVGKEVEQGMTHFDDI